MGRKRSRMTKRWDLVYRFLKAYVKIHGVPPTYEIMAKGLGMKSRSNMHRIVKRLEEEGFVETQERKFLSIRLVDRSVKEISAL